MPRQVVVLSSESLFDDIHESRGFFVPSFVVFKSKIFKTKNMSNKLSTAPAATEPCNRESLTVAFLDFNGVYMAKISNRSDRETYAFGPTTAKAQLNAYRNYKTKYNQLKN